MSQLLLTLAHFSYCFHILPFASISILEFMGGNFAMYVCKPRVSECQSKKHIYDTAYFNRNMAGLEIDHRFMRIQAPYFYIIIRPFHNISNHAIDQIYCIYTHKNWKNGLECWNLKYLGRAQVFRKINF